MLLVLNLPRLWISEGSEYVRLNRVLNMPEYAWLYLAEYAWICLNMPIFAWICPNLPEWFLLCNTLSTWTRAYVFQLLHKTRFWSYGEWSCFPGDTNIDVSIVAVILFAFCFRLDIFTNKISNLLLTLEAEGSGGCESGYPVFSLFLL